MNQEHEVKFFVLDLKEIQKRLLIAGAEIIHPRVIERNLRFDSPDRILEQEQRVLRLRQDTRARLTYKGPAHTAEGISTRQEFEVTVSDFESTLNLLMALGYEISIQYEKYRTTYRFRRVEIVLDEMPYGFFVEIEGPDAEAIRDAAENLGMNWEARFTGSYLELFDRLRARGLQAEHLTFELLKGQTFTAEDFGLQPGDG